MLLKDNFTAYAKGPFLYEIVRLILTFLLSYLDVFE